MLITFEGPDGCGKSTQVELLGKFFEQKRIPYLLTFEPGNTNLGKKIREMLLHRDDEIDPFGETFLFLADRAQHFSKVVIPAITEGKVVVSDRCFDSTMVYQGMISGLNPNTIRSMSYTAMRNITPAMTFVIKTPLDACLERLKSKKNLTHFDEKDVIYHQQVHDAFARLSQSSTRFSLIDGTGTPEDVHARIVNDLQNYSNTFGYPL